MDAADISFIRDDTTFIGDDIVFNHSDVVTFGDDGKSGAGAPPKTNGRDVVVDVTKETSLIVTDVVGCDEADNNDDDENEGDAELKEVVDESVKNNA